MLNKMKRSFGRPTVRIALVAVVLALVSLFLPWLSRGELSTSLMGAYLEEPEYFMGLPAVILCSLLWLAVCFLLNHPKLSLVGILPLLFAWFGILLIAGEVEAKLGIGFFIYFIAAVVCVVMAFATKKLR